MDRDAVSRQRIVELLNNWAVWRDAGDWDRFRGCWHSDGRMFATWCQAPAEEFVRQTEAAWDRGITILHFLGGISVDVSGPRAVSQTKMTINQRAPVSGVPVDVVCTGRFYDLLEERDGRWGIVLRQPIYEKDRLDPVVPGTPVPLERDLLERFPPEYRHLAYVQTKAGFTVKTDMPLLRGEKVQRLYAAGRAWLRGEDHGWAG
ncbi:MAG: nuclear transport factor 2 family protein [Acetobacteraceae bacterium]|nr:nuclear transport factor 2 family protein [Acetobacteraceae bacterium]